MLTARWKEPVVQKATKSMFPTWDIKGKANFWEEMATNFRQAVWGEGWKMAEGSPGDFRAVKLLKCWRGRWTSFYSLKYIESHFIHPNKPRDFKLTVKYHHYVISYNIHGACAYKREYQPIVTQDLDEAMEGSEAAMKSWSFKSVSIKFGGN